MVGTGRIRALAIMLAVGSAVLASAVPASAGTAMAPPAAAPVFGQEQAFTLLPSNALPGPAQAATFGGMSCPTFGNCVGFGYYLDTSSDGQGWIAAETAGVWGQASELPSSATQNIEVSAVWCESTSNCVAVADLDEYSSGFLTPVAARETNGTWGPWTTVELPTNALSGSSTDNALFSKLSCTSIWRCVAVGSYVNADGSQPMAATDTFGRWSRAAEIALPAGASTDPTVQNSGLYSVSCWSWSSCVAVGEYAGADAPSGGGSDQLPMVATETGGRWGQASDITLPAGALTGTEENAGLFDVSCARGNCTAVGNYTYNTDNDTDPLVISETGGIWGTGSSITVPAAIAGSGAPLEGVDCESAGNCTTDGYSVTNGSEIPIVASESNGSWGPAAAVAYPGDASGAQPFSGFNGLACTRGYRCVAYGSYENAAGAYLPSFSASTL